MILILKIYICDVILYIFCWGSFCIFEFLFIFNEFEWIFVCGEFVLEGIIYCNVIIEVSKGWNGGW